MKIVNCIWWDGMVVPCQGVLSQPRGKFGPLPTGAPWCPPPWCPPLLASAEWTPLASPLSILIWVSPFLQIETFNPNHSFFVNAILWSRLCHVDIRVLRISTSNTPSPSIEFYRGQTKLKYTAAGLHLSWFQATLDRSWNSDCTMIGTRAYCRFDAGFIEPQCWSRSIPGPFCTLYIYISVLLYVVFLYFVFFIFEFMYFSVLLYFCICCRFYWSKLLGPTGAFRPP